MARKQALGRGLAALIGEAADAVEERAEGAASFALSAGGAGGAAAALERIPLSRLRANLSQPRKTFKEEEIRELAASLKSCGVVQPILVRPADGRGAHELIAGERRLRAAHVAGFESIPAIVRDLDDRQVLEIALVENLHRAALTPLEEAAAYKRLMDEFNHSAAVLAESLGKSRSHIANMTRLLALPGAVREMVQRGSLSAGHARACLAAPSPVFLAEEIVRRGLNVRQAESLARKKGARRRKAVEDPNLAAFARDLSDSLGLAVLIRHRGGRGGELRIRYRTEDQLEDLGSRLRARRD